MTQNTKTSAVETIQNYFAAFNAEQTEKMLALLHPEVEHEINQGETQRGFAAFKRFMAHMDACYREELKNMTIFSSTNSALDRVSAEYDVYGEYLKTDGSLPEARGQKYVIRAGSFFEVQKGLIRRVTTYYNLPLWIEMVKSWKS